MIRDEMNKKLEEYNAIYLRSCDSKLDDGSLIFVQSYLTKSVAYKNYEKHKEIAACVCLYKNFEKTDEYIAEK